MAFFKGLGTVVSRGTTATVWEDTLVCTKNCKGCCRFLPSGRIQRGNSYEAGSDRRELPESMETAERRNTYIKGRYGSSCVSYLRGHGRATGKYRSGRGGLQPMAKRQCSGLAFNNPPFQSTSSRQTCGILQASWRHLHRAEEGTRVLTTTSLKPFRCQQTDSL